MNPKLIAAALVIISLPVCAHAQKPTAAKVTNADAQKVVKMIGTICKIFLFGVAAPLGDAAAAYRQGNYATALRIIRPLASSAPAQFKLGLIYANGNGVPQDYREALKWYRQAADQGNAAAQRNLGVMFGQGLGVPQDYVEALKWFRRAAEQNDAAAQTNLGVMYDFGHGVVRFHPGFSCPQAARP